MVKTAEIVECDGGAAAATLLVHWSIASACRLHRQLRAAAATLLKCLLISFVCSLTRVIVLKLVR